MLNLWSRLVRQVYPPASLRRSCLSFAFLLLRRTVSHGGTLPVRLHSWRFARLKMLFAASKKQMEPILPLVPSVQAALPMELTVPPARTEMSLFGSQSNVSRSDLKRICCVLIIMIFFLSRRATLMLGVLRLSPCKESCSPSTRLKSSMSWDAERPPCSAMHSRCTTGLWATTGASIVSHNTNNKILKC